MTCSRPQRNVHRLGFEPGTSWSEIRCPNRCATLPPEGEEEEGGGGGGRMMEEEEEEEGRRRREEEEKEEDEKYVRISLSS